MSELTRLERAAVRLWQGTTDLHPLTCRVESSHGNMIVDWDNYLRCPQRCGYEQERVPAVVVDYFIREARYALAGDDE